MKIAVVSKYGSVPGSGTLTRLFYICKYLSKAGHDVEYIVSDSNHLDRGIPEEEIKRIKEEYGVNIKLISLIKYKNQKSLLRILSWIQFEIKLFFYMLLKKNDYIIVSSPSIFSIATGLSLKLLKRSKLAVDIRDIWPLTLIEEGGISKRNPLILLMHFIQNRGYKRANLMLSSIPRLDLHIKEEIGTNRPFYCVPMGYDNDDDFSSFKSQEITPEKISTDKLIVGYVGSIGISNNLDAFIETIKQLDPNKYHFKIVGDGDYLSCYNKKLAAATNVTFYGRVPKDTARAHINACDVMYFSTHESSIWKYGQSLNKLFDYMFAGKFVVAAYPENGHRSMLNEADSGLFIKANSLEDHINVFEELYEQGKEHLDQRGQLGQDWVIKHRNYEKLVQGLNKVLSNE